LAAIDIGNSVADMKPDVAISPGRGDIPICGIPLDVGAHLLEHASKRDEDSSIYASRSHAAAKGDRLAINGDVDPLRAGSARNH